MTTSTQERPGIEERYSNATNTRNLSLDPNKRTDADVLLAAGYAAAGNERSSLALRFYRLKATGDMTAFRELASIAGGWLLGRSMRRGRQRLRGVEAVDLATRTLYYWLNPSCKPCNGLGHPLIPETPVVDYTRVCPICHGSGHYPIHRITPVGTADEARWLVDEIDKHTAIVFNDMARQLSTKLDL